MYKYLFIFVVISLFFLVELFSHNDSVSKNKELINLIRKETGGLNISFNLNKTRDIGDVTLNKLNIGYYIMFEKTEGERTLTLMENNTAKFTYSLDDGRIISEVGFWKTNQEEKIEIDIIGNQFGSYDDERKFIFIVDHDNKKLISYNYEKLIYGDGGFVLYRK